MSVDLPSIAETPPDDESGRYSRGGYSYQDLCALRYCIQIIRDPSWSEVWCESHDDLVLYRMSDNGERYRFLQVKFRFNAGSHWSSAVLCAPPKKGTVSESIICKLFSKDRFAGTCDFRLLINEGVADRIKGFACRWPSASAPVDLQCAGAKELLEHLAEWTPPNGHNLVDYVRRFGLEIHAADIPSMEASVLRELGNYLQRQKVSLLVDELEMLFDHLYRKVYKAAQTALTNPGHPERVVGDEFREVALSRARAIMAGTEDVTDTRASEVLRSHLETIGVPSDLIESANDLRARYYRTWRRNAGTEFGRLLDDALSDVRALCMEERLRVLDDPSLGGRALLSAILGRAREFHAQRRLEALGVSVGLVYGMVYFLIARNRLEFA